MRNRESIGHMGLKLFLDLCLEVVLNVLIKSQGILDFFPCFFFFFLVLGGKALSRNNLEAKIQTVKEKESDSICTLN